MIEEEKKRIEIIRRERGNKEKEWWNFIKGGRGDEKEEVELKIGEEFTKDVEKIKTEIKRFWGEIGGMNEEVDRKN